MLEKIIQKMFLTVDIYEEEGTLEQRWGPMGVITCSKCDGVWPCNWLAFRQGYSIHSVDLGELTWTPWEKS